MLQSPTLTQSSTLTCQAYCGPLQGPPQVSRIIGVSAPGIHGVPMRVTGGPWSFLLRCSRHSECSRGQGPERWLWSFQPELDCLRVAALSPANISREERREVKSGAGGALVGRALVMGLDLGFRCQIHQILHSFVQVISLGDLLSLCLTDLG